MPRTDNPYPSRGSGSTEPLPALGDAGDRAESPRAQAPQSRRRRGLARIGVPFAAAVAGGVVALGGAAVTGNLGGGDDGAPVATAPANLPAAERPSSLTAPEPEPLAAEAEGPETAADVGGDALSVSEIVRQTAPGVVKVEVPGVGLGSGFLVDEIGHILTNQHVVDDAELAEVEFDDGSTREARVLGTDPTTDLAVLKVAEVPESADAVELGSSADVIVGASVVAIGSPFGLERTATAGIVSAVKRPISSPSGFPIQNAIQTDAAINSGNSGGPLFDRQGRVIGINSQIAASRGGGNVGIGFAVPIDTVKPIADAIIRTGEPEHAFVGIEGRALSSDLAAQLGVGDLRGVIVTDVTRGTGADRAGLEPTELVGAGESQRIASEGDIVVAADGEPVSDFEELIQAISAKAVGDQIVLTVRRGDQEREVSVTLGDRPEEVERRP